MKPIWWPKTAASDNTKKDLNENALTFLNFGIGSANYGRYYRGRTAESPPPRERVRERRKFKRIAFDVTCNYGVTIIGSNSYIYFETVWIGIWKLVSSVWSHTISVIPFVDGDHSYVSLIHNKSIGLYIYIYIYICYTQQYSTSIKFDHAIYFLM